MNKSQETLIKKLGGMEAYIEHMKKIRTKVKINPKQGSFNNPDFAKEMSLRGVEARRINKLKREDLK